MYGAFALLDHSLLVRVISYTAVKQYDIFHVEWYLRDLCVFHLTISLIRVYSPT